MLPLVTTSTQKLERYRNFISEELFKEIEDLAGALRGLKVFNINSTARGGGVAEILEGLVPIMKGVGLDAQWYTILPRDDFFEITKKIHNALQGKEYKLSLPDRKKYLFHMSQTAELMMDMKPDVWIVHDPQAAGVIKFLPNFHPSISRLHVDLTSPNDEVWSFMAEFLTDYDKIVVSSPDFVKKEIGAKTIVFQPAIDPLSLKNQPLTLEAANEILRNFGVNPEQLLISQVSRFDPWKDSLGVIKAYRLTKDKFPGLQLILAGLFLAKDDPEAERVYEEVKKTVEGDPNVFLFAEVEKLGSLEIDHFINAIQVSSDVILQKSVREGFGLTVTEAMWKEKSVIGGDVGGIKLQIKDGKNGFLVSTPDEAAARIIQLIENPELRKEMGAEAKKTVRENFLMPRLLRDYLRLLKELV